MPQPDELWKEVARTPARLRSAPRRRRSSGFLAAALMVGGILAALGGLIYWQMQSGRRAESVAVAVAQQAPARAHNEAPETKKAPLEPVGQSKTPVAAAAPSRQASPPPSETPPAKSIEKTRPTSKAGPNQSPSAAKRPNETATGPAQTSAHAADKRSSAVVAIEDTPERRAAFARAVHRACAALVSRDLPQAARQLDAAAGNVRLPAQLDEVEQLRALAEQLGLFFDAVRSGLGKYKPTEEINIDGLVAAIVDVRPDRVTLFIEGSKRSFTIGTMPAPMALFFARSGADENQPVAAAFFGAFHAVDPEADRERAGALWHRAAAAGVGVEDLLPLLDGPPLASRREPIPDAGLITAAAAQVQGPLADLIVTAESGPRKSLVATKLLEAARRADNSPAQYAALQQSRDWAVSAGDPATALAALDELDRWFDVDVLELKSKALGAALAGWVASKSTLLAATAALALSVDAERDGRDELALTFSDIAYNAARKTRESELIKRAYRRRSELSEKIKSRGRSRGSKSSPAKR